MEEKKKTHRKEEFMSERWTVSKLVTKTAGLARNFISDCKIFATTTVWILLQTFCLHLSSCVVYATSIQFHVLYQDIPSVHRYPSEERIQI